MPKILCVILDFLRKNFRKPYEPMNTITYEKLKNSSRSKTELAYFFFEENLV
jgi:hypothetical protein